MPKIKCDACSKKSVSVTDKMKYDLERDGFITYCHECATRLNLIKWKALKDGIKIYKMN